MNLVVKGGGGIPSSMLLGDGRLTPLLDHRVSPSSKTYANSTPPTSSLSRPYSLPWARPIAPPYVAATLSLVSSFKLLLVPPPPPCNMRGKQQHALSPTEKNQPFFWRPLKASKGGWRRERGKRDHDEGERRKGKVSF